MGKTIVQVINLIDEENVVARQKEKIAEKIETFPFDLDS